MLNPRPYSNLGSKVPGVGVDVFKVLTLKKKKTKKKKTKEGQGKIWGIIELNCQFDIGFCEGYQMSIKWKTFNLNLLVLFLQILENF